MAMHVTGWSQSHAGPLFSKRSLPKPLGKDPERTGQRLSLVSTDFNVRFTRLVFLDARRCTARRVGEWGKGLFESPSRQTDPSGLMGASRIILTVGPGWVT